MIEGTIDCQEARNRIGGYLSGTESSESAIELEAHFDECIDCRLAFEHRRESQLAMRERERQTVDFERIAQEAESVQTRSIASALRKQSLQQMLRNPVAEPVAESVLETTIEEESPLQEETQIESTPDPVPSLRVRRQWKPFAYTFALVSVLAAAILVSANSGAIFESPALPREPGAVDSQVIASSEPIETNASDPAPIKPPFAKPAASIPADGLYAGETVGSDAGLTLSTAKPTEPQYVQPPTRSINRKRSVRRKTVRRGSVRRSSTPQQGVRVYNP